MLDGIGTSPFTSELKFDVLLNRMNFILLGQESGDRVSEVHCKPDVFMPPGDTKRLELLETSVEMLHSGPNAS